MATNVYFNQAVRGERNLHEDIVIETIKIGGMDVYYIPREIVEIDTILNEDIISKFTSAFKIEMLLENVDGFEGDGKLLSKFGLEIRDQITLILSVKRWKQCISRYSDVINGASRPREGDLIYFPAFI